MTDGSLISFGLPVRNGASTIAHTARSVLAQDHADVELVISDNASTDETEEVCRALVAEDPRVVYARQPVDLGVVGNFLWVRDRANGNLFRWIGDDDWLAPTYASTCVERMAADPRVILVTTQLEYISPDGTAETRAYEGVELRSDDPVARLAEMLRLLTESHLLIDPIYSFMRRDAVAALPYRSSLHGDETLAAKMALAGPWSHVSEVLGGRHWTPRPHAQLARLLGASRWQLRTSRLRQASDLLDHVQHADLTPEQRRRARAEIVRWYTRRAWRAQRHRVRRVGTGARGAFVARPSGG